MDYERTAAIPFVSNGKAAPPHAGASFASSESTDLELCRIMALLVDLSAAPEALGIPMVRLNG